jgi:hypothetical protein
MPLWKPGENIIWRYVVNRRPWYIQSAVRVTDRAEEIVIGFLPGAEGAAELEARCKPGFSKIARGLG